MRIVWGRIGIAVLVMLVSFGLLLPSCTLETPGMVVVPITYTEKELVPVHTTTTVYVPEIIETRVVVNHTRLVDNIIYQDVNVPRPYQRWESVEQFTEWYESQNFTYIFLTAENAPETADCDNYAERLQKVALRDGFPVSQALVSKGLYFGIKVRDDLRPHAGNLVLIDGTYYYVEPHPRDMFMVRIAARD